MKPSQQERLAKYMRDLRQLHRDVSTQKIAQEEARQRLDALKIEHKQLLELGIPLNTRIPIEEEPESLVIQRMRQRVLRARVRTHKLEHALNFKCQCKRCVRLHTITMADRDYLHEMGISWSKVEVEETPKSV
jgi:hypothetical protein